MNILLLSRMLNCRNLKNFPNFYRLTLFLSLNAMLKISTSSWGWLLLFCIVLVADGWQYPVIDRYFEML